MNKLTVGQEVACNESWGRGNLSDDHGVIKAVVVEVDPKTRAEIRERRDNDVDVIHREPRSWFSSVHKCYIRDPAGEPLKGFVLLRWTEGCGQGEVNFKAVRKQKVLGTWAEHLEARKLRERQEKEDDRRQRARKAWDDGAVKAINAALRHMELEIVYRGRDASVEISLAALLKILGIPAEERP